MYGLQCLETWLTCTLLQACRIGSKMVQMTKYIFPCEHYFFYNFAGAEGNCNLCWPIFFQNQRGVLYTLLIPTNHFLSLKVRDHLVLADHLFCPQQTVRRKLTRRMRICMRRKRGMTATSIWNLPAPLTRSQTPIHYQVGKHFQ